MRIFLDPILMCRMPMEQQVADAFSMVTAQLPPHIVHSVAANLIAPSRKSGRLMQC